MSDELENELLRLNLSLETATSETLAKLVGELAEHLTTLGAMVGLLLVEVEDEGLREAAQKALLANADLVTNCIEIAKSHDR